MSPLANLTKLDRLDLGRTRSFATSKRWRRPHQPHRARARRHRDRHRSSPSPSLVKLERLSIKNTRVGDVSPLAGMTHLKTLSTGGSPVTDFHVLGGLVAKGLKIDSK